MRAKTVTTILFLLLISQAWGQNQTKDATEKMVDKISQANKQVQIAPPKETCSCQLDGELANIVGFETPNKCGEERNYLNNDLSSLPNEIKNYRDAKSSLTRGDFPMKCVTYIQRDFNDFIGDYNQRRKENNKAILNFLAKCPEKDGEAERYPLPPCVTAEYASTVYNSFVDVTDCLGLTAKELIPKIGNESGFHINAHSAEGDDAGIGQLTAPAINDVNAWWPTRWNRVKSDKKASCQRIAKYPNLNQTVNSESKNRCSLISIPDNPLRNILYAGFLQKNNETYVDNHFNKREIVPLIALAGLKINDNQIKNLKKMLVSLGYNAGAGSAVIYLENYLKAKIEEDVKVKASDFDINLNTEGSFAKYLKSNQTSGHAGYLNALANKKASIDKALGKNVCTLENYLKL